jgi:hypothetical protein
MVDLAFGGPLEKPAALADLDVDIFGLGHGRAPFVSGWAGR